METPNDKDLSAQLRNWAISGKIAHSNVTKLLHILKPYHKELPLDSRTLLCTPLNLEVKNLATGNYIHLGLQRALENFIQKNDDFSENHFDISFNIDGIPLYNSTRMQAWPILGMIKNVAKEKQCVFTVGVFCGESKPSTLELYLEDFVVECIKLMEGVNINGEFYMVYVHFFICDAPAKAFIKQIKSPGGYSCCDKCFELGKYVNVSI